jgi:hypothetical protein
MEVIVSGQAMSIRQASQAASMMASPTQPLGVSHLGLVETFVTKQ